jgi:hypothetical protein
MRRRSGKRWHGVFKRRSSNDKYGQDVKAVKSTLFENALPINTQQNLYSYYTTK